MNRRTFNSLQLSWTPSKLCRYQTPPHPTQNENFPRQACGPTGLANQVKMRGTDSWRNSQVTWKIGPTAAKASEPRRETPQGPDD